MKGSVQWALVIAGLLALLALAALAFRPRPASSTCSSCGTKREEKSPGVVAPPSTTDDVMYPGGSPGFDFGGNQAVPEPERFYALPNPMWIRLRQP